MIHDSAAAAGVIRWDGQKNVQVNTHKNMMSWRMKDFEELEYVLAKWKAIGLVSEKVGFVWMNSMNVLDLWALVGYPGAGSITFFYFKTGLYSLCRESSRIFEYP